MAHEFWSVTSHCLDLFIGYVTPGQGPSETQFPHLFSRVEKPTQH